MRPRGTLLVFAEMSENSRKTPVVPAKSLPSSGVVGGEDPVACDESRWVPAFAGTTENKSRDRVTPNVT